MNRLSIKYINSKLIQIHFAFAYRLNKTGVAMLHKAQQLIGRHIYKFEKEHYTSELVVLHKKIDIELKRQKKEYNSLRYSYGYPYQGLSTLAILGARSTEDRWHTYDLKKHLNPAYTILDIGCNCGFMSLYSVYRTGCKADCIDINPHMLNIGRHCAEMLKIDDQINFISSDFDHFKEKRHYEVVFSYAAHYTEDGQHRPDLRKYFERIHQLLSPSGLLVFESHGFDSTNSSFQTEIKEMKDLFTIEEHKNLFEGNRELFYFRKI